MTPEEIIQQVEKSGLRGRGGAGFPTGRKWRTVLESPGTACIVANGDESEPGAFKDRIVMEDIPHRLIEGSLIAAHAMGADVVYFFVRGEYTLSQQRLENALAECAEAGLCDGDTGIHTHVHTSAGAYICGEETALLEALADRRPMPRQKPPYPAVSGYDNRPTAINNVETLATIPAIVEHGGDWYAGLGTKDFPGTRVFSISGNVSRPGNYECVTGQPLIRMVEDLGGGIPNGKKIKAVIPGGTSTALLTPELLDVAMAPAELSALGSEFGTASILVFDEDVCMVDAAATMALFYRDESCGKCTPCREGTYQFYDILTRIEAGHGVMADLSQLEMICDYVPTGAVCGLGPGAVPSVSAALKYFRDEFVAHIKLGRCPFPKRARFAGQIDANGLLGLTAEAVGLTQTGEPKPAVTQLLKMRYTNGH